MRSGQFLTSLTDAPVVSAVPIPTGHGCLVVLRIDRVRDQPGLGALQFFCRHALLDHLGDDRIGFRFKLGQRDTRAGRATDGEFRQIQRARVVPGVGRDSDLLVDDEAKIEAAV